MSRPLRIEYPGACYHATSRGDDRKIVFKSDGDRDAFLSYLDSAASRYGAVIHAYCLMTNHYHLLIETPEGNLSQIMHHINGAYTTYFNTKRKRAGHLFQGRYKAILVQADSYATELSRYIHLNPVRAGMVSLPEEYRWSSYRHYIDKGAPPARLTTGFILGYFGSQEAKAKQHYKSFVEEAIGTEYDSPLSGTVASAILGSAEFIDKVSDLLSGKNTSDRNLPSLGKLSKKPNHESIAAIVTAMIPDDPVLAKKVGIHLSRKLSRAKLKEIGKHFGMTDVAVAQTCRRLSLTAETDTRLRRLIAKAEKKVTMYDVEA